MCTYALLFAVALGAQPESLADGKPPHPERPYHELSNEMRDVLRAEARAESKRARAVQIHRLSDLFLEVVRSTDAGSRHRPFDEHQT